MRVFQEKIVYDREQLFEKIQCARFQGQQIIQSSGCFDVLHVGHIYCLQFAKLFEGFHVVTLNSDVSIKQFKGEDRPFVPEKHRAEQLAALESVDLVYIFSETTAHSIVDFIKPNIYVKGIEYNFSGGVAEREVVERNGGKVILSDTAKPYSSKDLISALRDRQKTEI